MNIPADRQYTAEHEWVARDGDTATIGITEFAANSLGDVVYLELPQVGATVSAGQVCGEIESTKSVSELYAPVTGTVVSINQAAIESPESVNEDPYGAGWLMTVTVTQAGPLLSADEYAAITGS
ncbi:MAG: glycine cleavage system protein GcvH [Beutenbergiaceae bacterium]